MVIVRFITWFVRILEDRYFYLESLSAVVVIHAFVKGWICSLFVFPMIINGISYPYSKKRKEIYQRVLESEVVCKREHCRVCIIWIMNERNAMIYEKENIKVSIKENGRLGFTLIRSEPFILFHGHFKISPCLEFA